MDSEGNDHEYLNVSSKLLHWNNWKPGNSAIDVKTRSEMISVTSGKRLFPEEKLNISVNYATEQTGKYKNWSRSSFIKKNVRSELRLLRSDDSFTTRQREPFQSDSSNCLKVEISKLNMDWGKRTSLHSIFHINEGDKVWNIINRGLFAEIKLWMNEYGNICCKATGRISVKGDSEKSIMEVNSLENLRKILNLTSFQWSSLCEVIQENKCTLKFNAFADVNIDTMSTLEKLWFFVCKRRHFLPAVCVSGKLSGAVKLMKELKIVPKIIITEVRDFKGDEIS